MESHILIIKFAAAGDVLRTTSILPGLKRAFPESKIHWLVEDEVSFELLKQMEGIERLVLFTPGSLKEINDREYDILFSLEEDLHALKAAMSVKAKVRRGYGLNEEGKITPFNKEAEYAFRLRIDDDLKFNKNTKTFPEIVYEMACLDYKRDRYTFNLPKQAQDNAKSYLQSLGISENDFVIGLNTGAGPKFAHKGWTINGYIELIKELHKRTDAKILLLGGVRERDKNLQIARKVGSLAIDAGGKHPVMTFAGIMERCGVIVSGDTLGMHIAIALGRPVVVMFGSTCSQEIDVFDNGVKLVSHLPCVPCYLKECHRVYTCMHDISVDSVLNAVLEFIPKTTKKT